MVFWHEAGTPVVGQPLVLRLKRSVDERKEKGDAKASGVDADSTARDKIWTSILILRGHGGIIDLH